MRHSKTILLNHRFAYNRHEEFIPLNHLLQDAKIHFAQQETTPENIILQQMLDLRLEQFSRDMNEFEKESGSLDDTEYHLMGAIMVNNECTTCCLYLRDYAESPEGRNWRVFGLEEEKRVTRSLVEYVHAVNTRDGL